MQSIAGLHVASLIDAARYDVTLYHEDWHGPYDTTRPETYDIVFLSGLQPDFDRMRQLSFFFRRGGSIVVAGGSVCTLFPEFATQFFDVVCAGGVDSARDVMEDFESGTLKPVYRSPIKMISTYDVDYSILTRNGISPSVHLVESSRGCSFKCKFCVIPSEVGDHSTYDLAAVQRAIDNSLATSPRFSFRRWFPLIIFLDNNFSDDRSYMLKVCEMMRADRRIRGWAALVTQNVLGDRKLIDHLAASKCMTLFAGIESFDENMLRAYNKKQNLGRKRNVLDDIAYAERLGIGIGYGYLFDPRQQSAEAMAEQVRFIAREPRLPMPVYLSVVAPLAGTESFWEELEAGNLAANLRLRDLDGESLCHANLADDPARIVQFIENLFRRPWVIAGRWGILLKTLRRIARSGSWDPIRWYVIAAANLHCFVWSKTSPAMGRTYRAGDNALDPQYFERPADISPEDVERYFEPIALTDKHGQPSGWLEPYIPAPRRKAQSLAPMGASASSS
jgi:pyruvate-formate lyase-activating enzyme